MLHTVNIQFVQSVSADSQKYFQLILIQAVWVISAEIVFLITFPWFDSVGSGGASSTTGGVAGVSRESGSSSKEWSSSQCLYFVFEIFHFPKF